MSWDVFIQDLPEVQRAADIPKDFRPGPLGERTKIERLVAEAWPDAEPGEPGWFFLQTEACDLSLHLITAKGVVEHMVVHVHSGDDAPKRVKDLLDRTGFRALDSGTGDLFDANEPERGYRTWKNFRDRPEG